MLSGSAHNIRWEIASVNSKKGRFFISKLKKETIFIDAKLHDIPNTMRSTIISLKDLKINYLTVHISAGLQALKEVKKVSGKVKIAGVTTLTSLDNKNLNQKSQPQPRLEVFYC